jgi:hypothetical protein
MQPLALEFPTRDPERLFFPTLHVHDGAVHAEAAFDHTLYWQLPAGAEAPPEDGPIALGTPMSVSRPARDFMDLARAAELVDGDARCRRRGMHGMLPNHDTWSDLAPPRPTAAAA